MTSKNEPQENTDEKFEPALVVVAFAALGIAIMVWVVIKDALASPQIMLGIKAFGVSFAGLASALIIVFALICAEGRRIRNARNR